MSTQWIRLLLVDAINCESLCGICRTPFKNKTNACKRLVRYHVFHELGPTPQELEKEEEDLETHAQQLLSKFHQMINKYHYLLLMVSSLVFIPSSIRPE